MRRVLILETNEALRRDLLLGLRERGIESEAVGRADEARATLERAAVDIAVLGPGGGPVRELMAAIRASPSPAEVVAIVDGPSGARGDAGGREGVSRSGSSSRDGEVGLQAIRDGAADFVQLSFGVEGVVSALLKIEARREARKQAARQLSGEIAHAAAGPAAPTAPTGLIGKSAKIVAVLGVVKRIAGVKAAVLVGGESGTGKELVARALHDQSPWREGPFVAVNCGALPPGLIESELFGHVRGSFTDAVRDKRGLFEIANGGTLFLDEIADLALALQSKLLRVVQDGMLRRVGDIDDMKVEVRLIAASARHLPAEVAAGRFREDLYYRLSGLSIDLPPLRERRDDIPILARYFLERACARSGLSVTGIDPEALQLLDAHAWPGNVRELENTIERAAVLCAGSVIDVASLPERVLGAKLSGSRTPGGLDATALDPTDLSIKRASRRAEEGLIKRALVETGGNRTRAAELLEISHRALLYKIKEYGIIVPRD